MLKASYTYECLLDESPNPIYGSRSFLDQCLGRIARYRWMSVSSKLCQRPSLFP